MGAGRGFSTPSALKEPGVVGVASELVSTEIEYESLIDYLLGRTLVVEILILQLQLQENTNTVCVW